MTEKTVAIIGAGIAGLAAGCYAQMNGYKTTIFESHTTPGGLCTAWHRHGYTFDGCIHWLTSSAPGDELYTLWEEIGAVQDRKMYDHDVFVRFAGADGRVFSMYADPDRLEAHMKSLSPDDAAPIEDLCGWIRKLRRFGMPIGKPQELMTALDGLKMGAKYAPYMSTLKTLSETTLAAFAERFKDPLLADGLRNSIGASSPLMGLVITLAPMSRRAAGYPAGGSLAFSKAIAKRYTDLGGTILYGARVARILEKDGSAVGVELEDGMRFDADDVISAADLRATLQTMLDGTRMDETHRVLLESGKTYAPCVQVSFGIQRVFPELDEPLSEAIELETPLDVGGTETKWLTIKSYAFDPSLAPEGGSVVTSMIHGNWEHWSTLRQDHDAYAAEKTRVADAIADAIDAHYPGFKDAIEITDVATPITFERYTGNWQGVFMTWQLTPSFRKEHRYVRMTVPGLDHFTIASMWTSPPGGLPGAALAGFNAVQLLCARDKKKFIRTKP
jgi:phytoene dehydrogenase-like protein